VPNGGEQAVVYQMQWNNSRPEVAITAIDMTYDPAVGDQCGTPALLVLTAASQGSK
jgi:hypothetical protein